MGVCISVPTDRSSAVQLVVVCSEEILEQLFKSLVEPSVMCLPKEGARWMSRAGHDWDRSVFMSACVLLDGEGLVDCDDTRDQVQLTTAGRRLMEARCWVDAWEQKKSGK